MKSIRERRKRQRFPLTLTVCWRRVVTIDNKFQAKKSETFHKGNTVDISSNGLNLAAHFAKPELGRFVEVVVSWPLRNLKIQLVGRVVRYTEDGFCLRFVAAQAVDIGTIPFALEIETAAARQGVAA